MKIVMIGTGNIGTYYSTCFKQHGHEIIQVVSNTESHAKALSNTLGCNYTTKIEELHQGADVYFFAIQDDALLKLSKQLKLEDKLVMYAAGALSNENFLSMSKEVACIWCVYSIQKNNLPRHRRIPLVVTGTSKNACYKAHKLAESISDLVYEMDEDKKAIVHLGAVFSNNFVNHLYHISENLLTENDISFDILKPIIQNTAEKIMLHASKELQTGPAIRNDQSTMQKHVALLNPTPQTQHIYEVISKSIQTLQEPAKN
ncbi:MAG: DUF2520 domain-containing protein [Chitinophagaceae bacterium]